MIMELSDIKHVKDNWQKNMLKKLMIVSVL